MYAHRSGCPINLTLETLGDRWSLIVIRDLMFGNRRHYRELLPRCQFVIVYDAAHAIYVDRPEAFAAIVGDFVEHRDQFVVRRESGLLCP